jgi:hypothetical protein
MKSFGRGRVRIHFRSERQTESVTVGVRPIHQCVDTFARRNDENLARRPHMLPGMRLRCQRGWGYSASRSLGRSNLEHKPHCHNSVGVAPTPNDQSVSLRVGNCTVPSVDDGAASFDSLDRLIRGWTHLHQPVIRNWVSAQSAGIAPLSMFHPLGCFTTERD